MVEFLVGLVGILFLMLGLHQIAVIVHEDFDSLIGSRQEVAEALVQGSRGTASYSANNTYNPAGDFYGQLRGNILYDDEYGDMLAQYQHAERKNGFEPLEGDPLSDMVGVEGGRTIHVESGLMRRLVGAGIRIDNQVWMPPWTDLMYE